jgi:hypothetical protein
MQNMKLLLWVEMEVASLLLYINAEELQNFTHVDGIYTANQNWY